MATIEDTERMDREPLRSTERHPNAARRSNPSAPAGHHSGALIWNVLTVLVWLGMCSAIMAFISIYTNPQTALNPLRPGTPIPPTMVAAISLPTATETSIPTATVRGPKPTRTLTPTVTPTATATLTPTITNTPQPSATPTIDSVYPFILRGDPAYISSATFPEHESCKLWVAGQTTDLQGAPMVGVTVMLGGYLDGRQVSQISLTGTALQFGQAGYEFTLADQPVKSRGSLWVQLFDQAMIPLSGRITFDTVADCGQNMVLINFKQVR